MTDIRTTLQQSLGGAYTIERELGGGGMSRTYVAEETSLHRRVVVKVLSPDLAAGVSVDRFKREIQLAAALQHPHIVPVLAAGDTNGLPYYTMPFVAGESLRVRLARGPLSVTQVTGSQAPPPAVGVSGTTGRTRACLPSRPSAPSWHPRPIRQGGGARAQRAAPSADNAAGRDAGQRGRRQSWETRPG